MSKESSKFENLIECKSNRDVYHTLYLTLFYYVFLKLVNGFLISFHKSKAIYWFTDCVFSTVLPIVVIYITLKKYKWVDIGFSWPKKGDELLNFIGYTFGVMFLLPVIMIFIAGFITFPIGNVLQYKNLIKYMVDWFVPKYILILYMSIAAGLFEEIIYKGVIPKLLTKYTKSLIRIVTATSALFAISHWEQGFNGIIFAFVYSTISFFIYKKINNLLPVILGHIVYDLYFFVFEIK